MPGDGGSKRRQDPSRIAEEQLAVCDRFGAEPEPTPPEARIGFNFAEGSPVLNGLRHPAHGNMSGWYVWDGERGIPQDAPQFFQVMHDHHLETERPEIVPYLALPPGFRFLIAPGHEDVWFDESLFEL